MDILEAIHTRRSIRKFTDEPVSGTMIEECLKAAMTAPSAGNCQPWHFVVIKDRATLNYFASINRHAGMCKTAQAAIIVCCDTNLEKYPGFWAQDCLAATLNLLLAAHGQGLGAVWCG